MIRRADVLGAVLAGGRSTRMGKDKSLLRLGGVPLIEHTVRLLQAHFPRVVLIADEPGKYGFLQLEIFPDVLKGIGPLGGIHAALSLARSSAVFISACDIPLVPSSLIDHLLTVNSPLKTRIPQHDSLLQPLFGLYDGNLLPAFTHCIESGERRVISVLGSIPFLKVDITPELPFYSSDMFCNVNSPGEFASIESRFAGSAIHPDPNNFRLS